MLSRHPDYHYPTHRIGGIAYAPIVNVLDGAPHFTEEIIAWARKLANEQVGKYFGPRDWDQNKNC